MKSDGFWGCVCLVLCLGLILLGLAVEIGKVVAYFKYIFS